MTKVHNPSFLNCGNERTRLELKMRRSLGMIARVALVFSRRGLDIAQLKLEETRSYHRATITLEFVGSPAQLKAVKGDLSKLIDIESLQEVPMASLHQPLPSLTQMQAALTC
jgi:acetolactate synthase regulatory subunit